MNRIVAEARTWIGTPFRWRGRSRGRGVDCVGLLVGVARALGLADVDCITYGRRADVELLRHGLDTHLDRVATAAPGDVYLLAIAGRAQHVGIASPVGLIHVYASIGRVVEHPLGDKWARRVRAVYRFRGALCPP